MTSDACCSKFTEWDWEKRESQRERKRHEGQTSFKMEKLLGFSLPPSISLSLSPSLCLALSLNIVAPFVRGHILVLWRLSSFVRARSVPLCSSIDDIAWPGGESCWVEEERDLNKPFFLSIPSIRAQHRLQSYPFLSQNYWSGGMACMLYVFGCACPVKLRNLSFDLACFGTHTSIFAEATADILFSNLATVPEQGETILRAMFPQLNMRSLSKMEGASPS